MFTTFAPVVVVVMLTLVVKVAFPVPEDVPSVVNEYAKPFGARVCAEHVTLPVELPSVTKTTTHLLPELPSSAEDTGTGHSPSPVSVVELFKNRPRDAVPSAVEVPC